MKDGGWIVDAALRRDYKFDKYCIIYNAGGYDTFWGHVWGSKAGYVKAIFKGSGTGILDFGNCFPFGGVTIVYLNDIRIGAAGSNKTSVVISFDYKRDDVLKVSDEGTGIMKINSLKLESCEKEGKNILVML